MLPPPDHWFFIAGCQRSGTTLLRLALECHSQVFCFDEIDAYRVLVSGRYDEAAIDKPLVGFKIPRWTEQLDQRDQWDPGIPERMSGLYRGQKILFFIRDWRDVVVSMMKLKFNRTWLETWGGPIIDYRVANDAAFAAQWATELKLRRESPAPLVATGALVWKYKSQPLLRYNSAGYPLLGVSYERLVTEPEPQLRRICTFLDVPFERSLLEHPRFAHREVFPTGLTVGNTDPKRAIDQRSVGQWQGFLDADAIAAGEEIVSDLPEHLAKHLE